MLARPVLEKTLANLINQKHSHTAIQVIELIQNCRETPSPNLNALDEQNQSFLYLSVEADQKEVSRKLFALQKNDDDIIFSTTSLKASLFWIAAERNDHELLGELIAHTKSKPADHSGYRFWLKVDKAGDAPLHRGALALSFQVVKQLLTCIAETETKDNASAIVNLANKKGNTALHLALNAQTHYPKYKVVDLLLKHGAKLDVPNNQRETPFKLFLTTPIAMQEILIANLESQHQHLFLTLYKKEVNEDPDNEEIKKNYIRLANRANLKELVIARLEYDGKMPLRETYNAYKPNLQNPGQLEEVVVSILDAEPTCINDSIPVYTGRLFERKPHTNIILNEPEIVQKPDRIELLILDKKTLDQLISEAESYLADLKMRPNVWNRRLITGIVISWVAYLLIETWLIYEAVTNQDYQLRSGYNGYDCKDINVGRRYLACEMTSIYFGYCLASVLFGTGGGGAVIGAPFILGSTSYGQTIVCCDKYSLPPTVPEYEWQTIFDTIQKKLLNKLHSLKDSELPVKTKYMQTLENALTSLYPNQLANEVIPIFKRILHSLKAMRRNINLSNKPFTLFNEEIQQKTLSRSSHPGFELQEVIISEPQAAALPEDNETMELLSLARTQSLR